MKLENRKNSLSYYAFYAGLIVLYINSLVVYTDSIIIFKEAARVLTVALWSITFVLNFKKIRVNLPIFLILGLSIISVVIHGLGSLNFILIILFALCASTFEEKLVFDALVAIILISIVIYIVLYVTGTIQWGQTYYDGRLRNNMGFNNENTAASFFTALLLIPCVIVKRKLVWAIVAVVVCLTVYGLTNSRGVILVVILLVVCSVIFFYLVKSNGKQISKVIATLVFMFSLLATFVLPFLGSDALDYYFSFRLSIFQEALRELLDSPFGLFWGSPIEVDNAYICLLSTYGIVSFCIILYLIQRALNKYSEQGNWIVLAYMCMVLSFSFIESNLFRPEIMLTLAFWYFVFKVNFLAMNSNK